MSPANEAKPDRESEPPLPEAVLWSGKDTGCSAFTGMKSRELLACLHCREGYPVSLTATHAFNCSALVMLLTPYSRAGSCLDKRSHLIIIYLIALSYGVGAGNPVS